MATIHTIWQNTDLKIEDWKDVLDEYFPEGVEEDEAYDFICKLNNEYLDDERMNLNKTVESGRILVIADLGLWDGRHMGYKIIESGSIADCLTFGDCDYVHWYVDGYGQFRATAHHHDGVNRYLYREIKPGISAKALDILIEKILSQNIWDHELSRCTRKIGPYIQKIYGW